MLVVTLPSAWFFVKETKGIPLEALDKLWQDDAPPVARNSVELSKADTDHVQQPYAVGGGGGNSGGVTSGSSRAPV